MLAFLRNSVLYEINTWVWLHEWSTTVRRTLSLAELPDQAWDELASLGVEAVWLMGIWERSRVSAALGRRSRRLLSEWRERLPDLRADDVVGSPYSICRYEPAAYFGGRPGLAAAREALARRGIRLILDFVPNHLAPDHPWVAAHPDWFIRGSRQDLRASPKAFAEVDGQIFARGRDPYFPPWSDVLQLNAFNAEQRRASITQLRAIAEQCDGVRCDMAMLVMNEVFARTWGERAGAAPADDYWPEIIAAVHSSHPTFKFIAEAYWGLEPRLLSQSFDAAYDKGLYDQLARGSAPSIRQHLTNSSGIQDRLVHFLENHDEPRASQVFPGAKGMAAAVILMTVPGNRLLHEGQLEGRTIRTPVHVGRRAAEAPNATIRRQYTRLLSCVADPVFHDGSWQVCECSGWPDNSTYQHLLAWCWAQADSRYVVVVNYSSHAAQGRVRLPWQDLAGKRWRLRDCLDEQLYGADGDELARAGLFVALASWGSHVFELKHAA